LQRTQGWGTRSRGGIKTNQKDGPPARWESTFRAFRPKYRLPAERQANYSSRLLCIQGVEKRVNPPTGNTPDALKQDFLEEVRISSAISDALKVRGGHHVYKEVSKEETPEGKKERRKHSLRREEFREELRSKLQHYAETYKQPVDSEQHITNITTTQ
jgi:hypothetical protein